MLDILFSIYFFSGLAAFSEDSGFVGVQSEKVRGPIIEVMASSSCIRDLDYVLPFTLEKMNDNEL